MTGLDVEAARKVLLDSLPSDPKWVAWVDGAVERLAECVLEGVVLTPEEAHHAATCVRMVREGAASDPYSAAELDALAARLEAAQ